jgi:Ca2+-binding EF-hand superfamily protein
MLMDLYRAMNKEFHPTATDIASYARIFDRENKGKISLEDMERFIIKYYCNED